MLTTEITISVPGRIGGKGRPRFTTRGGFARAYTPRTTREQEDYVRQCASLEMRRQKAELFQGPLALGITIMQTPPLSWTKDRVKKERWITTRPDADNCIKLIGDALNGTVWLDDSQIAELNLTRQYGRSNSVSISVRALE